MSTVSQTSLDLIQKVAMLGKSGTAKNIYRRKSDKKVPDKTGQQMTPPTG